MGMTEKRRFTVSLPDHVTDAIEKHARTLGASPTEYAGDVLRWWFGQGCPPVRPDEEQLRSAKDVNVWKLNPASAYHLVGDEVVCGLMAQLNVANLFAEFAEFDEVHTFVAFEDHPTHWIVLHLWKGHKHKGGDGLLFEAWPKADTSREAMLARLRSKAREMGASEEVTFSQLPARTETAEKLRAIPS